MSHHYPVKKRNSHAQALIQVLYCHIMDPVSFRSVTTLSLGLIWFLFALTEKLFSSSSLHVFNFKESDQRKQWEELRVGEGVGPGEGADL